MSRYLFPLLLIALIFLNAACGMLVDEKKARDATGNLVIPGKFPPIFSAGGADAESQSFRMQARIGRVTSSPGTSTLTSSSFVLKPGVQSKE